MPQIQVTLLAYQDRGRHSHTYAVPTFTTVSVGPSYLLDPKGTGCTLIDTATQTEYTIQESLAEVTQLINDSFIIDLATNDIGRDAWGRPKTIMDKSILHGMFTFNIPVTMWKETFNGTERAITNSSSVDGTGVFTAGASLNDVTVTDTFRHPRYEPNRGHLYSTALFLPSPDALGERQFGTFTTTSGVFFSLESGSLYAVVRSYTTGGGVVDDKVLIDTTDIDLSKGHTYDIQFQWRGVGNYFFYIDLQLVHTFEYLGTRTELSMYNPANPISFRCENLGDNVAINVGCVDVSTEGGVDNGKMYGSIGIDNESGQVAIVGTGQWNIPIIAVRSKLLVGGLHNTRDTLMLLLSAYADQRSFVRVWATRDFTAIAEQDQSWVDFGDGHLEYITYDNPDVATPMTFDTAKAQLIFGCRVGQDLSYATSALFEGRTDIYLTSGDMFVITMHRETGAAVNCGATLEFAESI